jgi:hypothetical protein
MSHNKDYLCVVIHFNFNNEELLMQLSSKVVNYLGTLETFMSHSKEYLCADINLNFNN